MVGEWIEIPIGEIAEVFDGPHATPAKTESGPIFLGISNLDRGRLNLAETEHLSEDDWKRWTRRVTPSPGDVVFSYETRIGEAAFIPKDLRCCLGRRMGLLRARPGKVDPRFLLYAYLGPQFQEVLRSRTIHGSTVDRIPLVEMSEFPILVPKRHAAQRAIACILGSLDDKIELNRRMNRTLEEMARAIFKSWFIDFDPVRAKAAVRREHPKWTDDQVSRAACPKLKPEIARLFPDSLVKSELGEAPLGWSSKPLAELAELNPENWSRDKNPEKIEYVDLTNTKWGRIDSTTTYRREDAPSRAQRVLRPGDTVVGTVRPGNGSYALISKEGLTGSTGFAVLRPRKSEFEEFVYLAATAPENIDRLAHLADGAAYPAVRPETVLATPVVRPTDSALRQFGAITKPLMTKIAANSEQSRVLSDIRDALLPKLISGELRILDAERIAARYT